MTHPVLDIAPQEHVVQRKALREARGLRRAHERVRRRGLRHEQIRRVRAEHMCAERAQQRRRREHVYTHVRRPRRCSGLRGGGRAERGEHGLLDEPDGGGAHLRRVRVLGGVREVVQDLEAQRGGGGAQGEGQEAEGEVPRGRVRVGAAEGREDGREREDKVRGQLCACTCWWVAGGGRGEEGDEEEVEGLVCDADVECA